jgi:phage shock protein A
VAEPIFLRVRRVISAGAEEAVDAMERVSSTSVMREAIRQVERALDQVRQEHEAAIRCAVQAKMEQDSTRARIRDLEEKARFALGKGRDDLAEAALSSQLDLEARLERLGSALKEGAEKRARLEESIAALTARKAEMDKALREFELARRDAALGSGDPDQERRIKRNVERAQATFDRVMANSGGPCVAAASNPEAAKLAEIDAIRRETAVAERLAALRDAKAGGSKKKPVKSRA